MRRKTSPPGRDAAGLRAHSPNFGRLRDDRRRSGRKTLDQVAQSGDLHARRQATWGMSEKTLAKRELSTNGNAPRGNVIIQDRTISGCVARTKGDSGEQIYGQYEKWWMPKSTGPIDLYIGQAIRARRQELGITQAQLAEEIGVRFQQIQKYESGKNRISASYAWELSVFLGVPVGSFFPGGAPKIQSLPLLGSLTVQRRLLAALPKVNREYMEILTRLAEDLAARGNRRPPPNDCAGKSDK